ncbi:MAG TPA: DUF4139 domain-containing protein [Deltaproteobacteria bacterium]|nr:DUF4139 domain-containing protein [Deltaproteobacteria bacterium]
MEIASQVDEVLVHRLGATITRRATLSLRAGGSHTIRLGGLPLSLMDPTVRIGVEGLAGGAALQITGIRVTLHTRPRSEVEPEPDTERLEAARREAIRIRRRRDILVLEQELLQQIQMPGRPTGEVGKAPPASPMVARVQLDGFVDEATAQRQATVHELDQHLVRLQEEIVALEDAVRRRDAARRARPDEVSKAVIATLRAPGAVEGARLVLRYQVPAARWVPVYQVQVDGDGGRATVTMRASVAQASGESWSGVRLSLSTALPQVFTELPRLAALRIGKAQPRPQLAPAYRPPPVGASVLYADLDRERRLLQPHRPSPRPGPSVPRSRGLPPLPAVPAIDTALRVGGSVSTGGGGGGGAAAPSAALDEPLDVLSATSFGGVQASAEPEEPEPTGLLRSAPAPAPRRSGRSGKRKSLAKASRSRGEWVVEEEEEDEEDGLGGFDEAPEASRAPAFASLRLPDATSPERGRLRVVDQRAAYVAGLGVPVDFDVVALVERATAAADTVRELELPVGASPVGRSSGRFDHSYRTEDRIDVPSDGQWHTVPVLSEGGPCKMWYVVVPREDVSVFRVASFPNPLRQPLLAGPVEVYVGGAYQLTGELPTVAPGEDVSLGMGVEPAVRCARNVRYEEQRSGEQVVSMTELHHTIEIQLRNGLQRAATVQVRERIPQPARGAEVAVDEVSVEPAWTPYHQRERLRPLEGGRQWEIELPAGGTADLVARYVVRIYANNEVVGGNRREA